MSSPYNNQELQNKICLKVYGCRYNDAKAAYKQATVDYIIGLLLEDKARAVKLAKAQGSVEALENLEQLESDYLSNGHVLDFRKAIKSNLKRYDEVQMELEASLKENTDNE